MQEQVAQLLPKREGHFVFESGHHGQVWLDLELLFLRPERVQPLAEALADRLRAYHPAAVCGPLVEGAFVAPKLQGKRVVVVNDVINAGSAVRASLRKCGAQPIAIGTLAVYGDAASELAARHEVALEALASFPTQIWEPSACPLCAKGVPLNAWRPAL